MGPVDELKDEHKSISLMLQILTVISRKLETGAAVKTEHFDQILEFVDLFLDKCHHGKEETLLFFAMEEAGVSREEVSLDMLVKEHQKGRQYVRELTQAVARYKGGDRGTASSIAVNIRDYVSLLTRHIEVEESVLYPAAEGRIPPVRQQELLKEFGILEVERIGPGRHDKLKMSIRRLGNFYLE